MRVVYIAGPFRSTNPDGTANQWEQHANARRAESLALAVWRLGAAAICPHLNTAHFQGAADDAIWIDGDLAILGRCDAVLMTPDWERSAGARAEMEFATANGIPAFERIGDLEAWLLTEGVYADGTV